MLRRSALRVSRVADVQLRRHASSAAPVESGKPAGAHISISRTDNGIGIVTIDSPGEKVNVLSAALSPQLDSAMRELEGDAGVRAVVLISGKPDNFVAGADIGMLSACKTSGELTALARGGQQSFDHLAAMKKPVVAAINGACLGGGLELALACSYRIASSSKKTKLGFPEVMIGLLPGAGGTQRLPKLAGIQSALTLMTTGKSLDAVRAKKQGIVHEVVDPAALRGVAIQAASELANGTLKAEKRKPSLMNKLLEGNPVGRAVLFSQAQKAIEKAAGGHYPAPLAILECVKEGVSSGMAAGLKKESQLFGELGMTTVSQALRGIFFSQTATKKNPYGKPPVAVSTVGVLGAGLMGAGIAQVTSGAGLRVVMKDRDRPSIARGEKQISDALQGRVKRKAMSQFDKDLVLSRIVGVSDEDAAWRTHLGRSDIIIEAVPEDLALKHKVIQAIEPLLRTDTVFASNTSALLLASIATAAKHPERVLGMHYFSPVDKMPLLEIIPHAGTDPRALATAFDLGLRQGKTVIVVKDVPGFYVNRSLSPWATEALALVQGGIAPDALDAAVRKFGYPIGPVALADEVGVDVLYHTAATMKAALGVRMSGGPGASDAWLKSFVDKKMLGRKTGAGFYLYETSPKGKKSGSSGGGSSKRPLNPAAMAEIEPFRTQASAGVSLESAVERMVLRFIKECMHSLEDGVIKNAGDGDIGAVFGLGFPPFLGGPFRYADIMGPQRMADSMARYADSLGPQFAPPAILLDLAKAGKKFHAA